MNKSLLLCLSFAFSAIVCPDLLLENAFAQQDAIPQTEIPQTVDSQTVDSQTVDSQTVDSQTVDSQTADPQAADSQTAVPQTADSQTADSQAADSQTAVPQTAVPQTAVPQTAVPQTAVPQTADSQAADSQAVDSQTADPQTADPQTADPQTAVPQTADSQAVDSQTADPQTADPQTAVPQAGRVAPAVSQRLGGGDELVLNFNGTAWEEVLNWYAEEADLSLQIDLFPTGSVNYVDPTRAYSIPETLDILNRLLLDRGYALVRRGRMLMLIDLEMDNAANLISELAELVSLDDLDNRSQSDIVSCVFSLGSLTADAARQELSQLIGPWGRIIVLDSARQVKVTETASKLLAIRRLLENAKEAESNVVEIVLQYRGADEILELARPLLGLDAGQNSSESIRISIGPYGERIYATGLPGKVNLLESIISKADKPLAAIDSTAAGEASLPVFETHAVTVADSSTVFDVLQTLLAGTPDARIAIDPKTKSIVSYARPETHALIAATIAKLEGSGQEFRIINLRQLDPAQALLTINKFFGVTESGGQGPVVDGDPATKRLWVRGSADQIAMVEKLISELEGNDILGKLGDNVRMLPYNGATGMDALQQVQDVWSVLGRKNQIRTIAPSSSSGGSRAGIPDRRIHSDVGPARKGPHADAPSKPTSEANEKANENSQPTDETLDDEGADFASSRAPSSRAPSSRAPSSHPATMLVFAQANESTARNDSDPPSIKLDADGADIIVQFTAGGMIIASEDSEALDTFEALMQSFAPSSIAQSDLPTIFWLKYAKADATAELISTILGGGESSLSSVTDSISSGLGGGMLGLLGMGGGGGGGSESSAKSILTSSGSISIVPDARLNALIVQANPIDLELVEMILRKLDIQESPEDVEVIAKPALIPVIYQDAKNVAEVVKSVFADRMKDNNQAGGRSGGGQPSPQELIAALRGGARGGGNQPTQSEPAKIIVAVDERSNSLVVTATPQDFEEVKQLVYALDEGGMQTEESVEVVTLRGDLKADVVRMALESVLGASAKTTSSGSSSSASPTTTARPSTTAADQASSDEIRRRIEMFRSMRGGAPGGTMGGNPGGATRTNRTGAQGAGGRTGGSRGGR